jgi:excisionase family DNA binding protein
MTTSEAAGTLGLSRRRVQELIRDGALPAVRHGRDYWIEPAAVHAMVRRPVGRPRLHPDPQP